MSQLSREAYFSRLASEEAYQAGQAYFDQGFGELAAGRKDIKKAENLRSQYEAYLGSDAQLNPSPTQPYVGGFKLKGSSNHGQRNVDRANNLMNLSFQAAETGDFGQADELKTRAEDIFTRMNKRGIKMDRVGLNGTPSPGGMDGPTDLLMGNLVADARDLQDRDSDASVAFRESLTGGPLAELEAGRVAATRAISAGERGSARSQRDIGLARGSARGAQADAAIAARESERFATSRADLELRAGAGRAAILGQAAQKYEEYSRAWGVNVAAASQQYIDNKANVRDEYVNAMLTTRLAAAQLAGQAGSAAFTRAGQESANATQLATADAQIGAQDSGGGWGAIVGAVVGIGLAAFTGGGSLTLTTAAVGASLGTTVGAGAESAYMRNSNVG